MYEEKKEKIQNPFGIWPVADVIYNTVWPKFASLSIHSLARSRLVSIDLKLFLWVAEFDKFSRKENEKFQFTHLSLRYFIDFESKTEKKSN